MRGNQRKTVRKRRKRPAHEAAVDFRRLIKRKKSEEKRGEGGFLKL